MSDDEKLLDRIVSGVLRELGGTPAEVCSAESIPRVVPAAPKELILTESVITRELLEKKRSGATRLVVGERAVLTPLARDFLRSHGMEWGREHQSNNRIDVANRTNGTWKMIVVQSTRTLESVLTEDSRQAKNSWERELASCDKDAVERAVGSLCRVDVDGAVVLTSQPDLVACRSNRNSAIRGSVVVTTDQVKSSRRQIGANLYCVDPRGRSQMELRNLLREATASAPTPPQDWNER